MIHLFIHIGGSSPEICVSQNIFSEVLIKMFSALKGKNALCPIEIVLTMI